MSLVDATDSEKFPYTESEYIDMLPEFVHFFKSLDEIISRISANVIDASRNLDFSVQRQRIPAEQFVRFMGSEEFAQLNRFCPEISGEICQRLTPYVQGYRPVELDPSIAPLAVPRSLFPEQQEPLLAIEAPKQKRKYNIKKKDANEPPRQKRKYTRKAKVAEASEASGELPPVQNLSEEFVEDSEEN
ncbi:hypothetical protein DFS34DRAFT_674262 [Phlyctochytrium arcticum]|nr:hypothetical protein DFS34DRAFT_674262 [Phlyctochytrium arcticum]